MDDLGPVGITSQWIRSLRGKKNKVDANQPFSWTVEKERSMKGRVENTATVFLTNNECPFTCLMCDLWKNTTDQRVSAEQISSQLSVIMPEIKQAKHLKIYNSGNFFDTKAIPEDAYQNIAALVKKYETVIVESHPKLTGDRCLQFKDLIEPELQVAMGLETSNPAILSRLNKEMTLEDFHKSVRRLISHQIPVRAFILLKPPFLNEKDAIKWAKRSVDFAFECGVECCVVIPTRGGNGALDLLHDQGYFDEPDIDSLEEVIEYGVGLKAGRVFADLWDLDKFSHCDICFDKRKQRLNEINLSQVVYERIRCNCQIN